MTYAMSHVQTFYTFDLSDSLSPTRDVIPESDRGQRDEAKVEAVQVGPALLNVDERHGRQEEEDGGPGQQVAEDDEDHAEAAAGVARGGGGAVVGSVQTLGRLQLEKNHRLFWLNK